VDEKKWEVRSLHAASRLLSKNHKSDQCGSATDHDIPVLFHSYFFAAKQVNSFWKRNEVNRSCYAVSENVLINQELSFIGQCSTHFAFARWTLHSFLAPNTVTV